MEHFIIHCSYSCLSVQLHIWLFKANDAPFRQIFHEKQRISAILFFCESFRAFISLLFLISSSCSLMSPKPCLPLSVCSMLQRGSAFTRTHTDTRSRHTRRVRADYEPGNVRARADYELREARARVSACVFLRARRVYRSSLKRVRAR